MSNIQIELLTNQWVIAIWDKCIQVIDDLADEKARGYYNG